MKTKRNTKMKYPTEKQIKDLYAEIEKFRENNAKYLLKPEMKIKEAVYFPKIITTDKTSKL